MKKIIIAAALAVSALTAGTMHVFAQQKNIPMKTMSLEVGQYTQGKNTYYIAKMDGKMYGMVLLSDLEKLQSMWDAIPRGY